MKDKVERALTALPMAEDFMTAKPCCNPQLPLGQIGTFDDIAATSVSIASEEYLMTGENLQADAGFALRRHPTKAEVIATGPEIDSGEVA